MEFTQDELNAIAFEIMRQELREDVHASVAQNTADRMRKDYLISAESAEIAAKSALSRWSDVYCD